MNRTPFLVTVAALALSACGGGGGGGGGGGLNSTPTPSPSPSPTPTPTPTPNTVPLLSDQSTSRTFTSFAVRRQHDVNGSTVTNVTFPTLGDAAQLQIRYSTSDKAYFITLPDRPEGRIVTSAGVSGGIVVNGAVIGETSAVMPGDWGFAYSRLTGWYETPAAGSPTVRIGTFVYGAPTPAGDIPLVGSAQFSGQIGGYTDASLPYDDLGDRNHFWGSLDLDVNFGTAMFSGMIAPRVGDCPDYYTQCTALDLQNVKLSGTLAGAGSNGLSGQFKTNLTGPNSFTGLFAGPGAVEAFGKFHLPYLDPRDSQQHMMFGVWVAKKQ